MPDIKHITVIKNISSGTSDLMNVTGRETEGEFWGTGLRQGEER